MEKKKIKGRAILTTAVAATVYSMAAGKGPFNKMRFKEQHAELAKYVDANYPDCAYSAIEKKGRGYFSTVTRMGKTVSYVYFIKGETGYIFTEVDELF